jgi:hypothetical protein
MSVVESLAEKLRKRPIISRIRERIRAIRERIRGAPSEGGGGGGTSAEGRHY